MSSKALVAMLRKLKVSLFTDSLALQWIQKEIYRTEEVEEECNKEYFGRLSESTMHREPGACIFRKQKNVAESLKGIKFCFESPRIGLSGLLVL